MTAKLIPFPDDVAEDSALQSAFDRQRQIHDIATAVAQMVYRGRAIWIGGMALPWDLLNADQRAQLTAEAQAWMREGI